MTEQEWLESSDPSAMLTWLLEGREAQYGAWRPDIASDRQLRLFACACCREAGLLTHVDRFEAVGIGGTAHSDGVWAGRWAHPESSHNFSKSDPRADLLRCIFGNPWKPVTFECNCEADRTGPSAEAHDISCPGNSFQPKYSSTVLSIARSIYENRDWDAMPVLADALLEAGLPETVECRRCRGNGRIEMLEHCPVCPGDGRLPHPILIHLRPKRVKCEAVGHHHVDRCSGGRIQSPNAQFTRNCPTCQGTGFHTVETAHCRGCHVIDLLLGK